MGVIFLLSTEHFSSAQTPLGSDAVRFIIRKGAHWTEYFILAFLLIRASSAYAPVVKRHIILCVIVAVVYAVTDEWHQSFTPARQAKVSDVVIDGLGACCGIWFWLRARTVPGLSFIVRL